VPDDLEGRGVEEGLWRGGSHGNQKPPIQLSPPFFPCANRLPGNEGGPVLSQPAIASSHPPPLNFHPHRRGSQKLRSYTCLIAPANHIPLIETSSLSLLAMGGSGSESSGSGQLSTRGFRIHYRKTLPIAARPSLAAWSPQLDLIAIITSNENILLYRMNGQRVWGVAHRKEKLASDVRVERMQWRPDGLSMH